MSQASDLLAAGQLAHTDEFPAGALLINGRPYATGFACSSLRRQQDLVSGGWLKDFTVSFWGLAQIFVTDGVRLPQEGDPVVWNSLPLKVANVRLDPAGRTISITCQGKDK